MPSVCLVHRSFRAVQPQEDVHEEGKDNGMDDETSRGRKTARVSEVELEKLADLAVGELVDDRASNDEECQRRKQGDTDQRAMQRHRRHVQGIEKKE